MFGSLALISKKIFGRSTFSVITTGFLRFICFVRVRIDFGVTVAVKSKCNAFSNTQTRSPSFLKEGRNSSPLQRNEYNL